jgi:hypothetical protein
MVRLVPSGGDEAGEPIWSCATYPTCRGTLPIAEDRSSAGGSLAPADSRADRIRAGWLMALGLLVAIVLAYLLLM